MSAPLPSATQRGAALAIALLILVVITLLGVVAVRTMQSELRLANNAESRMIATQSADSLAAYVSTTTYQPVNEDQGFSACARGADVPNGRGITCDTGETEIDLAAAPLALREHGYVRSRREQPLFVEVNVLRDQGFSAKNYDFARFSVTAGFDRSGEGLSAAEVTVGVLRLHNKIAGVNYEQ